MRMAIKEKEVYEENRENYVLKKITLSMIHRDISCQEVQNVFGKKRNRKISVEGILERIFARRQ